MPASTTTALSTPGPLATMTRAPGSRYPWQDWEHGCSWLVAMAGLAGLLAWDFSAPGGKCGDKLLQQGATQGHLVMCLEKARSLGRRWGPGVVIPPSLPTLGCKAGILSPRGSHNALVSPSPGPDAECESTLPSKLGGAGGRRGCAPHPHCTPLMLSSPPQANLLRKMRLSGIITQGARRVGQPEYVRAYKVAYSLDGREFTFYKDEKQDTDKVGCDAPRGAVPAPPTRWCCGRWGGCELHPKLSSFLGKFF